MDKLQDLVDRVFADVSHKPAAEPLSEAAQRRDQARAESARKIERLKQARLQALEKR